MNASAATTTARPAAWFFAGVAAMVFAMAVIGAVTRLTGSGLSMVEWRPLIGTVPPLGEAEWGRVFALYRQTPEFAYRNPSMDLAGFKQIFFWEWFHRLWGRSIGVVALAVLVAARLVGGRRALAGFGRPIAVLFALGALQGLMGWFMVQSGLVDRPSVSHYRLALHLGLACLIYGLCLWYLVRALGLQRTTMRGPMGWVVLALISLTMLWGALVAGLDAGLGWNTWPLMGTTLLPPEAWAVRPAWLNMVENGPLVQFIHRWLAIVTALVTIWYGLRLARSGRAVWGGVLIVAVIVQVGLGIATLLAGVPIGLAAAHQAGALIVLGGVVAALAAAPSHVRF